jgi:endonuclease G
MPNFRRNHGSAEKSRRKSSFIGKSLMLIIIAAGLFFLIIRYFNENSIIETKPTEDFVYNMEISGIEYIEPDKRYYLPSSTTGQIIHHKHYSLSYHEKYELAEWVSYVLTKESLRISNVERAKRFNKDPKVKTGSAIYYDYSGSGYSRGHLAPAGDMAFSDEAMQESFFMSNITPQKKTFNSGIWNELEQNIRNWAWKNNTLYIVTGPVLGKHSIIKHIGKNSVGVPKFFYKVLLDIEDPNRKGIGFLIPNKISTRHLKNYVVSIDSIETLTGIDFFKDLLTDEEEEKLESNTDISKWKVSEKIFKKRLEDWNKK